MALLGITDHVEGPRHLASALVLREVADQTLRADRAGFDYAWFSEHHAYIHEGHLPAPLLLALHLAGQTKKIALGTAIICLNLHHPLEVSEQCAVADLLMEGRSAFGFGSGSTPEEVAYFGQSPLDEDQRHRHFEAALRLLLSAWNGAIPPEVGAPLGVAAHKPLPRGLPGLAERCWIACNSVGSARIAGKFNFNLLFSHLKTPDDYRRFKTAYANAGGRNKIAANRPVHVAADDQTAFARAEPALRNLWRRFQAEGKIPAQMPEPSNVADLCAHPLNFLVGSASRVADQLNELHEKVPFEVINFEIRWPGLAPAAVHDCIERLANDVRPMLHI